MQSLDTVRFFTRGEPLNLRNVMQRVASLVEQEAFIWEGESGQGCYGQIEKRQNRAYAQMCYVGCQEEADPLVLCRLLEPLVQSAGAWKALGVLADLPEASPLFEGFHKAGFRIWARQKVYDLTQTKDQGEETELRWRPWNSTDINSMKTLYREVVPASVQLIEPITRKSAIGMVSTRPNGSLSAYADLEYGPKGVWVQTLVDPEVDPTDLLKSLPQAIPELLGRPVYLCVRSYQPWVDTALENAGYGLQEAQILLVKHLVLRNQVEEQRVVKNIFESGGMEGSLPITQK